MAQPSGSERTWITVRPLTSSWPLAPDGTLWDSFAWEFYFWTGGMMEVLASTGEFTLAQLEDSVCTSGGGSHRSSIAGRDAR